MLWRFVDCDRKRTVRRNGRPIYDKLDRGLSSYNALHHQNYIRSLDVPQGITTTETFREHNRHRSTDWSELREFMRAQSESDVNSKWLTEVGVAEQATSFRRRRFSVDLGEVREFIAFREVGIHLEDEFTVWVVKKCVWGGLINQVLKITDQTAGRYLIVIVYTSNALVSLLLTIRRRNLCLRGQ